MSESYPTTTFRCGHIEISTKASKGKGIISIFQDWIRSKHQTSTSLCSYCSAITPRHAPPAKGTKETVAAAALLSQGHSLPALQAVQTRWEEIIANSTTTEVEDFAPEHHVLATEAEGALEKVEEFWQSVHVNHVDNSSSLTSSSECGPTACQKCHELLQVILDDVSDCDCMNCSKSAVENALYKARLRDRRAKSRSCLKDNSESPQGKFLNLFRRRRSKRSRALKIEPRKLSTIMEESPTTGLHKPLATAVSRSTNYGLWEPPPVTATKDGLEDGSPKDTRGLWQLRTPQPSSDPTHTALSPADSSRIPIRQVDESQGLPRFMASDSLWKRPRPIPPPKINPDSVEGQAILQRIRNCLNFPNATPLQLLSIRELPESLTNIDELHEFERDVLSLAWKEEDEKAAMIVKSTALNADSFDGQQAMSRIKRHLGLPESATKADILSLSKLPDALINKRDIKTLMKDLNDIAWENKDKLQITRLFEMARTIADPEPANVPLPPSPPLGASILDFSE